MDTRHKAGHDGREGLAGWEKAGDGEDDGSACANGIHRPDCPDLPALYYPWPLPASDNSASGAAAGPLMAVPSTAKWEPWHGQSQQHSKGFQCTMQPICVQVAERR